MIPAGSYQCKVVLNNNWDQSTGSNVPFNSDGTNNSSFTYDMSNNTTTAPSGGISQQVTVTFQVYLGNEDSTSYAGGVSVQGSIAPLDWTAGSTQLTDPDANLLYTGDVIFPIGSNPSVEFKFTKSADGSTWDWEPYSGNRTFTINDSSTTQILEWVYWGDVMPVPQNVTINVVGSDVNLTWDGVFGATDYGVYRSADPYSDFTLLGNTGGVTNYQDSGAGDNYRAGKYFYYVKAINIPCESVTDIDGNVYQTIQIGNQCWMAENLKVTHYRNGDAIPHVTDNSTWAGLSTGAYCYYNNDTNHADTYGALYNLSLIHI